MTTTAVIFMVASWGFVLGLTFWSFRRLMSGKKPESAPEGAAEGARR